MSKYAFTPSTPTEWFDVDTACQIIGCTPERLFELVKAGKLRARQVNGEARIDSNSLDHYCEGMPVGVAKPEPEVWVKINGKAYREI